MINSGRYKDSANEVLPELPPFYQFCSSVSILCCPLLCGNVLNNLDRGGDIITRYNSIVLLTLASNCTSRFSSLSTLETQSQDRGVWHIFYTCYLSTIFCLSSVKKRKNSNFRDLNQGPKSRLQSLHHSTTSPPPPICLLCRREFLLCMQNRVE